MATKDYGMHNPIRRYSVTLNPASVAANTSAEQSVTVTGVTTDDTVIAVVKPTLSAGLSIGGARISAEDTVIVTMVNSTAAPIDAGSEDYLFVVLKG